MGFTFGQRTALAVISSDVRTVLLLLFPQLTETFRRAEAMICIAASKQGSGGFPIVDQPFRLIVRAVIPSDVRAFVPIEAKPFQRFQHQFDGAIYLPSLVRVFDPDNEVTAVVSGKQPIENRAADVANVRFTGRTGRKSDPNSVSHVLLRIRALQIIRPSAPRLKFYHDPRHCSNACGGEILAGHAMVSWAPTSYLGSAKLRKQDYFSD
mgnify:CR=1 FL=1